MDWEDRVGRRLKPRDLHIFMAVAKTATWPKPPSASRSRGRSFQTIANLEHTLGVPLFDHHFKASN
jgi:DNA-binding transcriptional LysR family regulator